MSVIDFTHDYPPSIRCAHCQQTHTSVEQVRVCSQRDPREIHAEQQQDFAESWAHHWAEQRAEERGR